MAAPGAGFAPSGAKDASRSPQAGGAAVGVALGVGALEVGGGLVGIWVVA